ncbi:MAG: GH3 auxin-responsive promoter family protein [Bacteroidia bacterium]|nr:GH3 auxin-responsive promoter family protein [Bacteroidia bacterium]
MNYIINTIAEWNLKRRIKQIEASLNNPFQTQETLLMQLIKAASLTEWGEKYDFSTIETVAQFQERVPVNSYETLFPYIEKMLKGEPDILWHGNILWFAKSSGTTNDKSKFIPVTEESLHDCHYKAGKDLLALYLYYHSRNNRLFSGKVLSIGGSHQISHFNTQARFGDLSAVMTENLPIYYEYIRTPSKKVALMSGWEEKLEAMCEEVMREDVSAIVGVPTWAILLIRKVLEKKGIENNDLSKVWPNLEAFFHGGVNIAPYKAQLRELMPESVAFINIYNASEGFFGIQYRPEREDFLLMIDYGIFYEFLPVAELHNTNPKILTLREVIIGEEYALIISTNGGLWRYMIGDTVKITGNNPFTIIITGRTRLFINAFGEELMIGNAETAIAEASEATGARVKDYTAAPVYFGAESGGAHEWLIEFERHPDSLQHFGEVMDNTLRRVNSDYDAKRSGDMILRKPVITLAPEGTFYEWLKQKNKLGGQNKIPRLSNNRELIEAIKNIFFKTD